MFNRNGSSRTDTLVKLVLVLFISLLSFSVGTYVGKQVSDVDHRRAQVEGDYGPSMDKAEDQAMEQAAEEKDALSDEDIASLTEEFIKKEKPMAETDKDSAEPAREVASEDSQGYKKYGPSKTAAAPATAPTPEPPAKAAHAPAPKAEAPKPTPTPAPTTASTHPPAKTPTITPTTVAHRVAAGQPPAPDLAEPRKPNNTLPSLASTAIGKYTIQVASYVEEGEAKGHAAELKNKGWNAFYIPATIQGKTWYRVSVGLFSTSKSAAEFQKEFQREAKIETSIVQKIVN